MDEEKEFFFLHRGEEERRPPPRKYEEDPRGPVRAPPGVYYRCINAYTCTYGVTKIPIWQDEEFWHPWKRCNHALRHKKSSACLHMWRVALVRQHGQRFIPYEETRTREDGTVETRTRKDCVCLAHLDEVKYPKNHGKPRVLKVKRLIKRKGPVVCPAVRDSCDGKCSHAKPHAQTRFCVDKVHDGEVSIQCVPARKDGKPKGVRGIVFGGFDFECHRR